MRSRVTLLVLVTLLCLQIASAQSYTWDVDYRAIRDQIFLNEPAVFEIKITNSDVTRHDYRMDIESFPDWSAQTDPISHRLSGITVDAGRTETTTLLLHPSGIRPGRAAVLVTIRRENTNERISNIVKINVQEEYQIPIIVPKIGLTVILPEDSKLDPRDENIIQVEVKNRNQLDIKDLTLKIRSSLFEDEIRNIALQPLERKTVTFVVEIDPLQQPLRDSIVATANVGNKTFVELDNFEVIAYTTDFREEINEDKSFLRRRTFIDVTNPANSRNVDQIRYGTSFMRGFFTSTTPKASVINEAGSKLLEWELALEAGETVQLVVDVNRRPLFYLLVLAVIATILYYVFRSQLVLHKNVMRVSRQEGGISEIKVIMNVRNRGNTPIKSVKIIDKIPHIATITRQYEIGTLHPTRIIRHKRGHTFLRWDLESLEPHEERVINYTMKSRLTILGQFMLPVAAGKYNNTKGQSRKTRSNVLKLSA